ncbi:MAG TPA: UbiD family decarboxylase [Chloroflexota bacterium]|jgi:UbiD family decarboxylase|nr:UbiD family decarboxylase [Chloroflexota bacterium]
MPLQDLREWIARVEALGELTRVDGVDPHLELGGLVDLYQWEMGNPALLFDQIKGYPPGYRVLANVFTSLRRIALSLDLPVDYGPREFVQAWRTQLKDLQPIPPRLVDNGPVLQHQQHGDAVDITRFPAPLWHAGDGGRYLGTGNIVVMRDPDTGWINAGTYRVQVHDAQTAGIYISPGKHGRLIRDKYWARGQACPVAVVVGQDPLLLLLGGLEVEYGKNEYDVAGAIRRAPLEVLHAPSTGLPVPAHAEIVLEGEIPPSETHPEGPFGEWTGYYASGSKTEPVIRVRAVLHRDDPIVLGCLPGMPPNDNTYFRSPLRAALIWDALERAGVPGIVGVWSHEAGGGRLLNIIAIRQLYPGHAKQVGLAAASCHPGAYANRYVIVVDDDIDPTDTNQVLWALCTRTEVAEDIDLVRKCWSTPLDPMAYAGAEQRYYNNRLVIDACRPYDRRHSFPAVARVSAEEAQALRARWPQLFDRQGKVRRETRHATAGPVSAGG